VALSQATAVPSLVAHSSHASRALSLTQVSQGTIFLRPDQLGEGRSRSGEEGEEGGEDPEGVGKARENRQNARIILGWVFVNPGYCSALVL
jgi:hypothetical protein